MSLATLPVDLRDPRFPLLIVSPRLREPELLHVKIDGPVDIRYEQHRPREPIIAHDVLFPVCRDRIRRSANDTRITSRNWSAQTPMSPGVILDAR
jgi:hypothetical protein